MNLNHWVQALAWIEGFGLAIIIGLVIFAPRGPEDRP